MKDLQNQEKKQSHFSWKKNEPYKVELIEDLPEDADNFFLFTGRLGRPLRRTSFDEYKGCESI